MMLRSLQVLRGLDKNNLFRSTLLVYRPDLVFLSNTLSSVDFIFCRHSYSLLVHAEKNQNRKYVVVYSLPLCTRLLFDLKQNEEKEMRGWTCCLREQVLFMSVWTHKRTWGFVYSCLWMVAGPLTARLRAHWLFPSVLCCLRLHAVLQLKLQQRRTREELVSQGIMPRKLKHPFCHTTCLCFSFRHPLCLLECCQNDQCFFLTLAACAAKDVKAEIFIYKCRTEITFIDCVNVRVIKLLTDPL